MSSLNIKEFLSIINCPAETLIELLSRGELPLRLEGRELKIELEEEPIPQLLDKIRQGRIKQATAESESISLKQLELETRELLAKEAMETVQEIVAESLELALKWLAEDANQTLKPQNT